MALSKEPKKFGVIVSEMRMPVMDGAAYSIVKRHAVTLVLEDNPDGGTRATISIPIASER